MSKHRPEPILGVGPQGPRHKQPSPLQPLHVEPQGPRHKEPPQIAEPMVRFHAQDSRMPQPPAAVEPGKGAIPIDFDRGPVIPEPVPFRPAR